MASVHLSAVRRAIDHCYQDLPPARAYALSADGTAQRGQEKQTIDVDLTYGDVRPEALERALAAAGPMERGTFFDLGSGAGRGVITAALCCGLSRAVGVELLEPLHAAAVAGPLQRYTTLREQVEARVERLDATLAGLDPSRLSAGVELRCGDLFAADVSSADVVFCCWSVSIMQRLAAKLAAELASGARVITVGQRLPEVVDLGEGGAVQFEPVWREWEQCDWGSEAFVVHRTTRMGELAARRHRKKAAGHRTNRR